MKTQTQNYTISVRVCMVRGEGEREVPPLELVHASVPDIFPQLVPSQGMTPSQGAAAPFLKQVTTVVISLLNSPVVIENSCYPKGQPLPPCLEF